MAEEDGEEMASEESLGQLVDEEAKEHVNLVFIGHVGKLFFEWFEWLE